MINLQIEVETTKEYFDILSALLAGSPAIGRAVTTGPKEVVEENNVVAMPTKGKGKTKPAVVETVKEEPKVDDKPEPEPEIEDTVGDYDAGEVDELAEKLEEPETVKLTQDNVRALAVRYANACAPGDAAKDTSLQNTRREAFSELTKHFGVAKFTEIPAEKWPDVVEYVNEQRKARKLSPDAITD